MGRPEANRERIGDMLVASGLITRVQLGEALDAQRKSRLPIGKQLVSLGHVGEVQLIQILSNQLSVPWVSMERVEFPSELLSLIPAELADRHTVMPIYVRNVRGRGDTLYVAMDDPTDDIALQAIAQLTGLKVRAMIASPSELRAAIEERYFGAKTRTSRPPAATPHGQFGEEPTGRVAKPGRPAKTKLEHDDHKLAKPKPPPPPKVPARVEGAVPVDQYSAPSSPPNDSSRTLTLLDGTRIQLPSAKRAQAAQAITKVRHVVKAVSAASSELSSGPLRWHDILQAVLDAAAARGVTLTRNEVAEAFRSARVEPDKAEPAKAKSDG
jgi:hypothetical protein